MRDIYDGESIKVRTVVPERLLIRENRRVATEYYCPATPLAILKRITGVDPSATPVMMVLALEHRLQPNDPWVRIRPTFLEALGVDRNRLRRILTRLESADLIETSQAPGSKKLIRIADPEHRKWLKLRPLLVRKSAE